MTKTDRDSVESLIRFIEHNKAWEGLQDADVEAYEQSADILRALLARAEQAEAKLAILDDDQSLTVAYLDGVQDGKPRVKPLNWSFYDWGDFMVPKPYGDGYWVATTSVRIEYRIDETTGGWRFYERGYTAERAFTTLEEAKAAAQADYERRILDALESRKPDTQPDPADVWDEAIEAAAACLEKMAETEMVLGRIGHAGLLDAAAHITRTTHNPYRKDKTDGS